MGREELEKALQEGGDWDPSLGFVRTVDKPGRRGWVTVHRGAVEPADQELPLSLSNRSDFLSYYEIIRERPYVVTLWEANDSESDGWQELLSIETEEQYFADLSEVDAFFRDRFHRSIEDIGWLGGFGREPGSPGGSGDFTATGPAAAG